MRPILLRELIHTRSKVLAGAVAGLVAGLVFGMIMQMTNAPALDGTQMSMMRLVATIVRSHSIVVGWQYHLLNSSVIGAIFGWIWVDSRAPLGQIFGGGVLYGIVWWVLGAQLLMPVLLGMPPFASVMARETRMVAAASLIGHVLYGLVLSGVFMWLVTPRVINSLADHLIQCEPYEWPED